MSNYKIDPSKFYAIVKVIRSVDSPKVLSLGDFIIALEDKQYVLSGQIQKLAQANNNLFQEIRLTTKTNPLDSFEDQESDFNRFKHTLGHKNFLMVAYNIINNLSLTQQTLLNVCSDLIPESILIESTDFNLSNLNYQKIQQVTLEQQLNTVPVNKFVDGILAINKSIAAITDVTNNIATYFDEYYRILLNRHAEEGIKVFTDPVITDVAISVYENIDAHGEIESGKDPKEISAYTLRKADIILSAIKNRDVFELVRKPEGFVDIIVKQLTELFTVAFEVKNLFDKSIKDIVKTLNVKEKDLSDKEFYAALQRIKDINPHSIISKDSNKLFTKQEKFNLSFTNETLDNIVKLLLDVGKNPIDVVQYVLGRKAELRKFYQQDNSFYTCKIGAGNVFGGVAPGALEVVPDIKPAGTLEEIAGSNFDLVRDIVNSIEDSDKWDSLFLATSPSKTTDKNHTLLISPAGAGKSMALKRIGAQKNSIGIYCAGSDFGTCWKSESQKNPKRLYESAVKLRKESKKHVHILIDEIDSVIPKKEFVPHGETDLTLEFQMLMDGVIEYPGITVWGTTNHPERIATPMIRRFKLLIVGELSSDDRIRLLKDYSSYMPIADNFSDDAWKDVSTRLEGAVGDVIRKVVEHVWRKKMSGFVRSNPEQANKFVDYLKNKFDDSIFDVHAFDNKMRQEFKNQLEPFCNISAQDLQDSVSLHLKNPGIIHEIQNAKNTYADAKKFISAVDLEKIV